MLAAIASASDNADAPNPAIALTTALHYRHS
jgi:hypothetical protein